jgi:hypothetical protein
MPIDPLTAEDRIILRGIEAWPRERRHSSW